MPNKAHTAAYWIERAVADGLDAVADLDDFRDRLGVARPLEEHGAFTRGRRPKSQERRENKMALERCARLRAQQIASAEAFDTMLADGRLRLLTRRERLEQTAAGHPDNGSVQAARRILARMNAPENAEQAQGA